MHVNNEIISSFIGLGKMIHTKVFLIFKYRQFVYGRFENRLYNSNPAATSSATASLLMAATRARPKFMTNPGPLPVITLSGNFNGFTGDVCADQFRFKPWIAGRVTAF